MPDDTEANGDELDGSLGEDDFHQQNGKWLGHAGCPVSDPPEADDPDTGADDHGEPEGYHWPAIADVEAARDQVSRIRATRCNRRWQLWIEPTVPTKRQIMRRKRGVPNYPRA